MPVFSVRGPVALPAAGVGDVATGLVSYWPHNEGTGTTLTDTENAHNSSIDAAGWGSGDYNYASGRTAQIPDHAAFNPGTAFSVFAWVKAPNAVSRYAISQYDDTLGQRSWITGTDSSVDNKFRVFLTRDLDGTTAVKRYRTGAVVLDNTYHHFGFTWGSSTLKLYVDGALDTHTVVNDDTFSSVANASSPICFGDLLDNGGVVGVPLNGFMKKVRYYNIEKSAADVLAIYTLGP